MQHLNTLVEALLTLLAKEQQTLGGFTSTTSPDPTFTTYREVHTTVFYPSLILLSLQFCSTHPTAATIIESGLKFLISQKSDHWSFNYWDRYSLATTAQPYPDDLDDTALALAVCTIYKKEIIDGTVLAHLVQLLTQTEEQPGGPYTTWLVGPGAPSVWRDVDVAVNSNLQFLLALHNISLPHLTEFLDQTIQTNAFSSQYYHSWYPIVYFLARQYHGQKREQLVAHILSKRGNNFVWENPLATALMISSLITLQVEKTIIEPSVEALSSLEIQELTAPYPFVIEKIIAREPYYSGSTAWTIAACIEAFSSYQHYTKHLTHKNNGQEINDTPSVFYNSIVSHISERCNTLDTELRQYTTQLLQLIIKKDADKQIGLLPYYTWRSFHKEATPPELLRDLGIANMYGWMAYRVYDDFFDDEGSAQFLSVANLCLRECVSIYHSLLTSDEEKMFFQQLMDRIDAANTWEVTHCRAKTQETQLTITTLPNYEHYSRLADRSIGHALGPITILLKDGHAPDSTAIKTILTFFEHYIIARQLNDDMHDWEEDFRKGHINSIVAVLLKKWQTKNQKTFPFSFDTTTDLKVIQHIFWHETVLDFAHDCEQHIAKAKEAIRSISQLHDYSYFDSLLSPLERSTDKVKKEQKEMIEFLSAYNTL